MADPINFDPTKTVTEQTGGAPLEDDSRVNALDFLVAFEHLLKVIDIISANLPIQALKDLDVHVKSLEHILARFTGTFPSA